MNRKQKIKPLPVSPASKEAANFGPAAMLEIASPALAPQGRKVDQPAWSFGSREWLFGTALVAAVFLVYQPAWRGKLLWDDDVHVTRPEMQSWHGLYRIWFEVGATVQYYPLAHSVFWLEHVLWGDDTLGYHLVNIFLHAASAILVAVILRRLAVPGAYLAAAIFALHPVQVESVAWITELKNTLSGLFYLSAMLLYLHFDHTRKVAWYLAALGLFLLALGTKTVTATLPGALLVIFWWQRGRLSWKKDVLPLVPFFLLGATMGIVTAWWELAINKCFGPDFEFTPVQRILIAGRGLWFHLGKLLWPANLTFIYPRWPIDSRVWSQYLYPLGAVGLLGVLWAIRHRTRAPLAAVLYFGGTLFPVMGFFNLYTYHYSLIADHYQYLACLGIITLFSAGATLLMKRAEGNLKRLAKLSWLPLVALLAVLSWRQGGTYADVETLYRATLDQNPECSMACNNLAVALADRREYADAISYFRRALEINPEDAEARINLGKTLAASEPVDRAIAHFTKASEIKADDSKADDAEDQVNLGNTLAARGQLGDAIVHFTKALEIRPDCVEAHTNLGNVLLSRGQVDEAVSHYGKALKIRPDNAAAHNNLGFALAGCGRLDEAIVHYRKALEIQPDYADVYINLGNALIARGEVDEAIAQLKKVLEIQPDIAEAHNSLGIAFARRGDVDEAIGQYRKALEIKPAYPEAHNNIGIILGGSGRLDEAVDHFRKALEIEPDYGEAHHNLGLALASSKPGEALEHLQKALALATARNDKNGAEVIRGQIGILQSHGPDKAP